jgi:hypothetical protein
MLVFTQCFEISCNDYGKIIFKCDIFLFPYDLQKYTCLIAFEVGRNVHFSLKRGNKWTGMKKTP